MAEENSVPARIVLEPIAAPSILGLYGFAGATFMVAAHLAGWFGSSQSGAYLFPFAAFFGGLAQFLAGMWAFRARDGLATAMHGMWGSFWMAYGVLQVVFLTGVVPRPVGAFPEFGYWFVVLAAITWVGMAAAAAENVSVAWVLGTLAAGSTVMAIAQFTGAAWVTEVAGYILVISAIIAWYAASALMLEGAAGRLVWPVGKTERAKHAGPVAFGLGEPGVIRGQ